MVKITIPQDLVGGGQTPADCIVSYDIRTRGDQYLFMLSPYRSLADKDGGKQTISLTNLPSAISVPLAKLTTITTPLTDVGNITSGLVIAGFLNEILSQELQAITGIGAGNAETI